MSYWELLSAVAFGQLIGLFVFNGCMMLYLKVRTAAVKKSRQQAVEDAIARLEALVVDDDPDEQVLGFAPENDTAFD